MNRFYTLSSGSSGNAAFLQYRNTKILIDCGISAKRITTALDELGEKSVDAILITHEHSDHVCGLRVYTKQNSVPVFATVQTWEHLCDDFIPLFNRRISVPGLPFSVGEVDITPVSTCHDSANSVGYVLNCGETKYAVATDNGMLTADFAESLKGCDTALIEANYDPDMLQIGPYPYPLKQRILSPTGHMSNEQAGKLACALARSGTKRVVLGHLSKENNTPELAYSTVGDMLKSEGHHISLSVAERYGITDLLEDNII